MMSPVILNVLKKPVEKITLARQEEDCLNVCDKNSRVLEHCIEQEYKLPSLEDSMILGINHKKNRFRGKVSESLCIKEKRSSLNT